jgi:hypothetical protein
VAAASGVAFVVLTAATAAVAPPAPESDAAVGTIRDYLVGHAGGLAVSTALMGVATMAVVGFFAMVHGRLRRATGPHAESVATAFLIAATVTVAATLLGLVTQAALVHQIAPAADDSTLGAFYALWDRVFHTFPATGMALALLVSATGLRTKALPGWVCVLALGTAALMLVDVVEDLSTTGTNLGPLGLVAFGLANVWIVCVSVVAWRQRQPVDASGSR